MLVFHEIIPGISVLETPFGGSWSGVTLVRGAENVLIDSGANDAVVDDCLVPALRQASLALDDIAWLISTHSHGDHIGGHYRIKELAGTPVAAFAGSHDKVREPLKYSKIIRAKYPDYSPPPPPVLRGVTPDRYLADGERIAGRLRLVHTPGHDSDTVSWLDEPSGSLICGDSLQANGTASQGIGFYQSLPEYRETLRRLRQMNLTNIIAGHEYLPIGATALGAARVAACLDECLRLTDIYDQAINRAWAAGEHDLVRLTRGLIREMGGQEPAFLFLALYTVDEHLRLMQA